MLSSLSPFPTVQDHSLGNRAAQNGRFSQLN